MVNTTHRSKWLIFLLVAIAQFMVVLDNAITNIALPSIKTELGFSTDSLQWVITAYALAFGGFLLLGGRAADLFGRKKVLLGGMIAFALASFLIGISQNALQLISLRAFQGLAGAFMSPAALSIVLVTFRDGTARNKALSYWTLVSTGGAAAGLLIGGILTQYVGWRWNFFINVPIGIIMAILIARYTPSHEQEERRQTLDMPGALLVTSGLMLFAFGLSQAPVWGWTAWQTIATIVASLGLLGAFVYNESRVAHPLVPLGLFKNRNIVGANLVMAPLYAAMLGTFFLATLFIQSVLHYSPALTGLAFLPMPLTLALMSTQMPRLVGRYGYRRFMIIGPLITAFGLLWLSTLSASSTYVAGLLPALFILPVGIGMTMMPTIAAATSGVPGHQSGLASGVVNTSQQMGGALGLAILSGVLATVTAQYASQGQLVATLHGSQWAFYAAGIFTVAAVLAAITIVRSYRHQAAGVVAMSE